MDIEKILKELTTEEKASLCSGHDFWHTKAVERLGIPSVMMCDGPHGLRKQKGEGDHLGINESIETVCYPSASALASSFDRDVLSELGTALGKECQAEQVGMLLGPGVNIKRSPLCGRNFEYFSEDPYLSGELAASYVSSLQKQGVSACVKHFAANNQETRRMSGSSEVDERTLHEIYLPAFETVVKKGKTRSVMCAYNALNGVFASENQFLLTDVLREKWNYQGMVVTDWGAVKDRVKGLLAGLDLEMPGGPGVQDRKIVEAVKNGDLKEEVLDKAVRNILTMVRDSMDNQKADAVVDREQCADLSALLAEKCAVLLKNQGVLPISKEKKVVFIGEFAKTPRYQGAGSSHIHVAHAVGACEAAAGLGIEVTFAQGYRICEDEDTKQLREEAVKAAREAETAVIFAGLPDSYESEGGDRENLAMPENQNLLISAVAEAQPNTVVVLHGGSCMELPWIEQVAAVLCVHLGGHQVGRASVRLLYGEANPGGKLAETWPLKLEDNPSYLNFPGEEGVVQYREGIFVGYRYYDKKKMDVLFPFGYGLSYTDFRYEELKLDKCRMEDTEELTVSCRITNTGRYPGSEAVQLYVRDAGCTAIRPVRELKGFEKVALEPGESREVFFTLDKRAFASYDIGLHDWYVESGTFFIEVGASSRDIRLSGEVKVTGTLEKPVYYTKQSTVGELMKTDRGRAFIEQMMNRGQDGGGEAAKAENVKNMGEGSDKIVESMMMEMPLQSIVTFGRMTEGQLDDLLRMLNVDFKGRDYETNRKV